MQKEGATHADWAISLGLFLIYILTMFMILQPGIQPIYKETQLLDNMQSTITERATFILTKLPLIINTAELESAGTYKIKIASVLPLEKDGNKAAIFDNSGNYIDNAKIDISSNSLEFETPITLGTNKFWIYEIISPDKVGTDYIYENSFNPLSTEISNSKNNFTFVFGAPETIKGLDWNLMISKVRTQEGFSCTGSDADEDYTILKNILNYPKNKEFIIQIIDYPSPRYVLEDMQDICHIEDPFEQTSVFTREWIAYKLDKNGNKEPIRIHVKIW